MNAPPRSGFGTFARSHAWVLWTWLAAVALVHAVHFGAGRGQPSLGLALSSSALPALLVAAAPTLLRPWVGLAAISALAGLAVANAIYFRLFQDYIPLTLLGNVGQAWTVRGYGAGLAHAGDVALPLALVLASAAVALIRRGRGRPGPSRWSRALPVACCALGSVPALGWAWWVAPGAADTNSGGYLYADLVELRRIVGERTTPRDPSPDALARLEAFLDRKRAEEDSLAAAVPDPWAGALAGSSVLIVQVEALNRWAFDAELDGKPALPYLRSLARSGIDFTDVYDGVAQGRSSDADYMTMASQQPVERGAVSMSRPNLDVLALPALLDAAGYETFSAHAHNPGFWNSGIRHARYGYRRSVFSPELGEGENLGLGLLDRSFMERTEPMIAALHPPFLAWLITLTMHGPHGPVPASFPPLPGGELEGTPVGNYLRKARHTDEALRELVARLDAAGVMEHTTLVVYGDHTEGLGFDMEVVRRLAGVDALPPDLAAAALDRVPLLVVPPRAWSGERGVRVATPGTLVDMAPTVLHLLGMEAPRSWIGRSLLPEGAGLAAQIGGAAASGERIWSGAGCWDRGGRAPVPAGDCDALRTRAREQIEASWLVTRYDLERRLAGPPTR